MVGEWWGQREEPRKEAEGGQYKERSRAPEDTKPRKPNGLDRKADNGAVARSRAQYSPTGRSDI